MEQVVLKLHDQPEQLHIVANDAPIQDGPSKPDRMDRANQTDPLPNKILKAIQGNDNLKDITVAE
jgi:hypothetical protein